MDVFLVATMEKSEIQSFFPSILFYLLFTLVTLTFHLDIFLLHYKLNKQMNERTRNSLKRLRLRCVSN